MSSSTDDAPDWTFEIGTLHLEKDSALCEKSLANFDLAGGNGAGIEFGGPLESPKTENWDVCQGSSQESEKKPFVRQSAVDLANSDPFGMHYKWRNAASMTATRIHSSSSHGDGIVKHYYCKEHSLVPLQGIPNTMYRGVHTSRTNVSPKPENYSFNNTSRSVSKLKSSSKPLFSRSATLEWTSEGPSTQTPTSEWIDSFTKQHGLMKTATDQCKNVTNTSKSSLGITGTFSKYRILSKSPSAPGDDSTSKMTYANCWTNSSFEQDPTDSITDVRTHTLAHHGALSSEWEKKYYEKQSGWSRKLKMSGSQFLNVNWTTCNKRSPTFPLISPTSTRKSDRKPVSFEMTCDSVISSTSSEILRASTSFDSSRDSSASNWNPVRRRLPAIELHHSPNRSHEHAAATSNRRPGTSSSSSGWLSAARKQQARIKKCRAFGKLYTTVRVEDDDVSVLVTTD